jgi:hypothetical protein
MADEQKTNEGAGAIVLLLAAIAQQRAIRKRRGLR